MSYMHPVNLAKDQFNAEEIELIKAAGYEQQLDSCYVVDFNKSAARINDTEQFKFKGEKLIAVFTFWPKNRVTLRHPDGMYKSVFEVDGNLVVITDDVLGSEITNNVTG